MLDRPLSSVGDVRQQTVSVRHYCAASIDEGVLARREPDRPS
jgi:hypothetical protein